jgi:hypothetical protein
MYATCFDLYLGHHQAGPHKKHIKEDTPILSAATIFWPVISSIIQRTKFTKYRAASIIIRKT